MELKHEYWRNNEKFKLTFNRTNMELKLQNTLP